MSLRISRCRDSEDMEVYEESAPQETEPAEERHQAMSHGIFSSACDVVAMSEMILVSGLISRRM
jgi:hypothetical protein